MLKGRSLAKIKTNALSGGFASGVLGASFLNIIIFINFMSDFKTGCNYKSNLWKMSTIDPTGEVNNRPPQKQ